jgi:hypothetical protein
LLVRTRVADDGGRFACSSLRTVLREWRQPRDLARGVALLVEKTNVHELIQVEHGSRRLGGTGGNHAEEVRPT